MIGYYNYTVILTYIGAVSGFVGIAQLLNGNLRTALLCLMFSGFCDMFDGKIASTMKRTRQEKCFGIQIDSLSDLVCFGVLPALIGFYCSGKSICGTIFSALYLLCALIRLAWFNVDEAERQKQEARRRETYLGLPVTSSALMIPLFIGFSQINDFPFTVFTHWFLFLIAIAFLTPFHLKKPHGNSIILLVTLGLLAFATVLMGVA